VARSDADPAALATRLPRGAAEPDVVLIGADPGVARRAEWVAIADAWQLTVVDDVKADGVRALADRLAGRSLGVVLAGGGARAFTHIGVLRELEEAGVHIDRLAGSSVGAIVAGGYALGLRGDELEELCYTEFVRRRPFSDWQLPTHSLARGRRTRAGLARAFGAETVLEGLPRQLQVVSTDLISRTRQVHRRGNLVTAVQASCRLPVLFAPMPVEDRLLIDGGVLDNLPVDLLTDRPEGPVLAVNVPMGGGSGRRRPGPPRVPALGETLLRTMMIGSGGAVAAAQERGAAVLTPTSRGVGLLEFHQMDRMVQSGRQAARALLDQGGIEAMGLVTSPAVESRTGDELVPSPAEPVESVVKRPVG
jgi:NTE family protein